MRPNSCESGYHRILVFAQRRTFRHSFAEQMATIFALSISPYRVTNFYKKMEGIWATDSHRRDTENGLHPPAEEGGIGDSA